MIKRSFLSLVFVAVLGFSCSSDKDNDMAASSLEGTWDVSELKVNDSDNQDLALAKFIFEKLIKEDCELLSLTFKSDGTLTTRSGVSDFEIDFNAATIPCPTSFEEEDASWVLEGDQLTITDVTGMSETATIDLSNNTLVVAGEDIEAESLTGAEIVFKKR